MNKSPNPKFIELWRRPIHGLAFGFGAGLLPKAPGTAGSILAIPVYLLLTPLGPAIYLVVLLGLFLAGVWITGTCERELATKDHPGIVFDEVVGQLVALFLVPVDWRLVLAGFILFRLFDIWKPGPIGWLNDNVHGGWGIMLDDLAAGLAAALCLHGVLYVYGL